MKDTMDDPVIIALSMAIIVICVWILMSGCVSQAKYNRLRNACMDLADVCSDLVEDHKKKMSLDRYQ
jgi:outer membrane murein-binding lipoprotein Lpp